MVNFLNKDKQVQIPTGGGTFIPYGMIAPWMGAVLYQLYSQYDLSDDLKAREGVMSRQRSGFWHYFMNQEDAAQAKDELGSQYPPATIWHFETKVSDIINMSPEVREKFGEVVSFDVNVKTLSSGKYRHEFHMIALPAAVHAMAVMLGYDVPEFDLGELLSQDTIFNEEFQHQMIGNPDAKDGDPDHYENSVLWKRRAELWAALDEPNPRNFRLMNGGSKFDTTSDKLNECLAIANYAWTQPVYCKVVTVNDPRVDALTKDDKRLNIATIFKIYENKDAAQKDADEQKEKEEQASEFPPKEEKAPVASSALALPQAWLGMEADWRKYLIDFKTANPGLIPPVIKKAESELSVTEAELRAWWDQV